MYPWGDEPPDSTRANFAEASIGRESPVGCFPRGATTPEGLHDLGGNVWEWTRSLLRPYPYDVQDGREELSAAEDERAVRGGAFFNGADGMRAVVRNWSDPVHFTFGFRLVVSPFDCDL